MRQRTRIFSALAVLVVCAASQALRADWIVTHDGERFEVKGSWQQKGKLAVFTLPNGNLSSMRLDRIDVEASKKATEQAKRDAEAPPPPPAAEEPKRKAVIVLTDKDFKKPLPADAAPAGDAKSGAKPGKDAPPSKDVPSAVEVVGWDRVPAAESKADGIEINGTLRNKSLDYLTEIVVMASLFDDSGVLIGRFPATVENQVLAPTESSKFHLVATGQFTYSAIKWDTQGRGFHASQDAAAPAKPNGTH
jgi:hypothetical protein